MTHSRNVTTQSVEKAKQNGYIEVEFENYNITEEIRVNSLLKDFKIQGKPTYNERTFSKMFILKSKN